MPLLSFLQGLVKDQDDANAYCAECGVPFSLLVRRHACGLGCGRSFCSKCTLQVFLLSAPRGEPVAARACVPCYKERKRLTPEALGGSRLLQSIDIETDDRRPPQPSTTPPPGPPPAKEVSQPRQPLRRAPAASPCMRDAALRWDVPPPLTVVGFAEAESQLVTAKAQARARAVLTEVAAPHLEALARQLLVGRGVANVDTWAPLITRLAHEAAGHLSPPAMAAYGNSDPREYVKIKRLSGPEPPSESRVVDGIVLRKNVVHRSMRTSVVQPRVLMLRGELSEPQVDSQVASLDKAMEQGPERARQAVEHICSFAPDVLLLEKTLPGTAREPLLARDVTVVQHVKPRTLERLSRCLNVPVATSVHGLTNGSVGTCKEFEVDRLMPATREGSALNLVGMEEEAPAPHHVRTGSWERRAGEVKGARTLMTFRGCNKPLGCTVMLRGASLEELADVKRVLRFMVYASFRTSTEASVLSTVLLSCMAALMPPAPPMTDADASIIGTDAPGAWFDDIVRHTAQAAADSVAEGRGGEVLSVSPYVETVDVSPSWALAVAGAAPTADQSGGSLGLASAAPAVDDQLAIEPTSTPGTSSSTSADDPLTAAVRMAAEASAAESTAPATNGTSSRGEPPRPSTTASHCVSPQAPDTTLAVEEAQHLWVSVSTRVHNTVCEEPTLRRFEYCSQQGWRLASFLASLAAPAGKKCPSAGCSVPLGHHTRTFLHGHGRVTMTVHQLAEGTEFSDRGNVWLWSRPLRFGDGGGGAGAWRVPLPLDGACMALGHLLELLLLGHALEIMGLPVQTGFVHYLAMGSCVVSILSEHIEPAIVRLPLVRLRCDAATQRAWLTEEVDELGRAAREVYGTLEYALQQRAASLHRLDPGDVQGWYNCHSLAVVVCQELDGYLDALQGVRAVAVAEGAPDSTVNVVLEVNRLRRQLAVSALTWVAAVHDPAVYARGPPPPPLQSHPVADDTPREGDPSVWAWLAKVNEPAEGPAQGDGTQEGATISAAPRGEDSAEAVNALADDLVNAATVADGTAANARSRRVSLVGIVSPRQGEGLVAQSKALSGPVVAGRAPFGSAGSAASVVGSSGVATDGVAINAPSSAQGDAMPLVGSLNYDGHFADWARFIDGTLTSPAEDGALSSAVRLEGVEEGGERVALAVEEAAGAANGAAEDVRVKALQAQQWADLEAIGQQKLQGGGKKCEIPAGAIPLLTADVAAAAHLPDGQGIPTITLQGRSLLPLGVDHCAITVFDDEPTSAVAHVLISRPYATFLQDATALVLFGGAAAGAAAGGVHDGALGEGQAAAARSLRPEVGPSRLLREHGDAIEPDTPPEPSDTSLWRLLSSPEPHHFRYVMEDVAPGMPWSRARFQVTIYFAPQFHALRQLLLDGSDALFAASVSRCRQWNSRGGKSQAYFAKTRDNRWIVKQLSKTERQSFLELAPNYFRHVGSALKARRATALGKIVGAFQVACRPAGPQSNVTVGPPYTKEGTIDCLIMENMFYGQPVQRIYDLKGSDRSRYNAEDPTDAGAVLLDENLKETNTTAPLLVLQDDWSRLLRALQHDTGFLSGQGVMDYSLLVGVDRGRGQLVVGVIDYVRQYTWDKQLETWVKSSGLLGGAGKEPTVISPVQYAKRFCNAIAGYLTLVPSGLHAPPGYIVKQESGREGGL